MKRLSVNLPDQLHKRIKVVAHLEDETISNLVLKLVHQHLNEQSQKNPKLAQMIA